MQRGRNPLVNCTVHTGVITLEVVATAADQAEAERWPGRRSAPFARSLGKLVYGVEDQTLAEVVGEELARTGKTLAVAESCTGGLLAELITDIPGSSRYFTLWLGHRTATRPRAASWTCLRT